MGAEPFPSVADVLYLSGYPFLAVGLLWLRRPASRAQDHARLVETAILTTGVAVLAWDPLIEPYATDASLGLVERAVSLAYPLADVLLVAVLVRLAVGVWSRTPAYAFLVAAIVANLAADTVYAVLVLEGTYVSGHPVDAGWIVFYLLVAGAALHPSMRTLSQPSPEPPARLTKVRLVLLTAATLLAPMVMAFELSKGEYEHAYLFLTVSVVLFLLVVARMRLLVKEAAHKSALLSRLEEQRKRLLERTLRAGEDERTRVAVELHDGPIQRLSSVGYGLELGRMRLGRGDVTGMETALDETQQALSEEIQTLRHLMSSLRPPALDEQGLEGALRDQVAAFRSRSGVDAELAAELAARPDREVETVLYRVAQEALTNVAKHARASRVRLELRGQNGTVELAVSDDGVGFDTERPLNGERFGLVAMREQVRMAGGDWEVTSRLGQGTTTRARLPGGGNG
ncbi:MAG: sensor histidine kinase [Actinomycetota bacterium]